MSISYIVFCRIVGLKELHNDELSAAVDALSFAVKEACEAANKEANPARIHSSVYGRLLVVSWPVAEVLEIAQVILKRAASAGVGLAIGIASGRVVKTEDVPGDNVAGVAVNRAARLAHLDRSDGKIAVEEEVVHDHLVNRRENAKLFGRKPLTGTVKHTELEYRWLKVKREAVRELRLGSNAPNPKLAHIVVYDIVGFSKLGIEELREAVGRMQEAVQGAFLAIGRNAGEGFWYAPAGDGGVVVFEELHVAWTFAKEFRKRAEGTISARVGVATGQVVVLDSLPVGSGIIQADAMSALPGIAQICVSKRFWKDLGTSFQAGWDSVVHSKNANAFVLRETISPPEATVMSESSAGKAPAGASTHVSPSAAKTVFPETSAKAESSAGEPRKGASMDALPTPKRCLVVLSNAEEKAQYTLKTAVTGAIELLNAKGPIGFAPIEFQLATDTISSTAAFEKATRDLCEAEVAVFDITGYEPAVMLLIGIRAVVRRGVSILSLGGPLSLSSIDELPFNIKDANLVSHAEGRQRDGIPPEERIMKRIEEGMKQVGSPEYLDLPAYDAVRNLPGNERTTIPAVECVLTLVSFREGYVNRNWDKVIFPALRHQQKVLRQKTARLPGIASEVSPPRYGIVRSVDIDSPRLVSSAIYGFIRRAALCVADWTDLRANVFFELGVRLAASSKPVVCLIDNDQLEVLRSKVPTKKAVGSTPDRAKLNEVLSRLRAFAPQVGALIKLFRCESYESERPDTWKAFAWIFDDIMPVPAIEASRAVIRSAIDIAAEPAAIPVHRELMWSALRFATDETKSVSCVLYDNDQLESLARNALRDRMLAAWTQIEPFSDEEILSDVRLWEDWTTIVRYVSEHVKARDPAGYERIESVAQRGGAKKQNARTSDQAIMDARSNRDLNKFDAALSDLGHAIKLLETKLVDVRGVDREIIVGKLADCLGMQGGVLRRMGKHPEALAKFQAGLVYEQSLGKDTYNLSNVVAERVIASPASLPQLLDTVIADFYNQLEAQKKDRDNQWWYHADWGMYHLLHGKYGDAEQSYKRFGNKLRKRDYEAILGVLQRMRAALEPVNAPIAEKIAKAIDFLTIRLQE